VDQRRSQSAQKGQAMVDTSIFSSILEHYQGLLSVYTAVGIMAVVFIGKRLLLLIPAIRQTQALNKKACEERTRRVRIVVVCPDLFNPEGGGRMRARSESLFDRAQGMGVAADDAAG
jgi:hypothetical protein